MRSFTIPSLNRVAQLLKGRPGIIAGSALSAEFHDMPQAFSDVDVFCPSQESLVANVQLLLSEGFQFDSDKYQRIWNRWLRLGAGHFHTHSIQLKNDFGDHVNLVYKRVRHADALMPLTSATAVIETFDFGFLAVAYDCATDRLYDMRSMYSDTDVDGAYPLLPLRANDIEAGLISEYMLLREIARFIKYYNYGYNMNLIRQQFAVGYDRAAKYYSSKPDARSKTLGRIALEVAAMLREENYAELEKVALSLEQPDPLDVLIKELV